MDTLRFRALWALIAAADEGSTNQAARALNLTQPAVSHAIKLIEEQLGVPLFNRRSKGMVLTDLGEIFSQRVRRAMNHLVSAESEIARITTTPGVKDGIKGLHRRITRQQLVTLVSVAERRSVQYASQDTGYSQSVIWHALRELRGLVGETLVEHRPSGIALSASGEILVRYAKLAFAELRYAHDDLAAFQGNLSGRVMIGALPLSRTILLPRAIAHMAPRYPNLEFTLVDGPYSTLLSALRSGDIDVIVGALRTPAPADDVIEEVLFREPLSIAAGIRNPLVHRPSLELSDLVDQQWILPIRGSPTRNIFESVFKKNGLTPPTKVIESSSLIATRALLLESNNYLTLISRSQIHYEEEFGILAALRVNGLADTERPIGVTTRADASVSPGVRELIRRLHTVSRKLYHEPRMERENALKNAV
ncbi:MAG TPA: LysR family transcriptional regulator [Alphaproteobacteria bacterium]|jgi:DNA-binding transcriptional LysR family regulator